MANAKRLFAPCCFYPSHPWTLFGHCVHFHTRENNYTHLLSSVYTDIHGSIFETRLYIYAIIFADFRIINISLIDTICQLWLISRQIYQHEKIYNINAHVLRKRQFFWTIRVSISFIYLYKIALSWSCDQYYIGGKNSKVIDYMTTMHMHCILYYQDNMFRVIKDPKHIFDVCCVTMPILWTIEM